MTLKELKKYVYKYYWNWHGKGRKISRQHLTVDTPEDRTYDPLHNYVLDVCMYDIDKKSIDKFLFTITNYKGFTELERTGGGDTYEVLDCVSIASRPYYIDRMFFIRKWTTITDEDILKCTRYFIDKILGLKYKIWNISLRKQEPEEGELSLVYF